MDWNRYFAMMADWKKLPAYKAEPRVDSLVAYYLPEIVTDYLEGINRPDKIVGIIPELPIRLGTVRPDLEGTKYADRSHKVDFYLLGASGNNFFVEFKTDSGSRSLKQDHYLRRAKEVEMESIVKGICQIADTSTFKKKYEHLLTKMKTLGILDDLGSYAGRLSAIHVIYVQPRNWSEDKLCIDFLWISDWMKREYGDAQFESEVAKTLKNWADD